MSHSRSFIRPCAEFPNDNPELHDGVSWVCLRVGAPLRPIARARLREPEAVVPSLASIMSEPLASVARAPVVAIVAEVPAVASAAEPHEAANEVVAAVADAAEVVVALADAAEVAVAVAVAVAPEVDVEAIVAAGVDATAPPPSVFALSPEVSTGYEPDTAAEERQGDLLEPEALEEDPRFAPLPHSEPVEVFGDLALELTPARSEVRASTPGDDLELDDLELEDEGFAFDGGADIEFTEGAVDATPSEPAEALRIESTPVTPAKTEPPAAPSAFDAFVAAVAEVAIAAGAAPVASALPSLLSGESVAADTIAEGLRVAPSSSASVFDHSEGRIRLSGAYRSTGDAWAAILRGESGDMAACGTSTLDGWAGDILRALGVGHGGSIDVKRELRRRGVAAFGMLLAA